MALNRSNTQKGDVTFYTSPLFSVINLGMKILAIEKESEGLTLIILLTF